jgi:hypothetical protein
LDICEGLSALQVLAGLYHDVVYYQIDGGLPEPVAERLLEYVEMIQGEVYIRKNPKDYRWFEIARRLFGFELGAKLSIFGGLNEFLSTIVALEELEKYLWTEHLLCIIVCIEATIPFRALDSEGRASLYRVEQELRKINKEFKFYIDEDDILRMMRHAVVFGNKDVENFADKDPAMFLENTWQLLPESNPAFWQKNTYTISEYRKAMAKMSGFLHSLNPNYVFHQYREMPNDEHFEEMVSLAKRNITVAREYIDCKLLGMALVEALALYSGGDAPVVLFMGGITDKVNKKTKKVIRAEDYFPDITYSPNLEYNMVVGNILDVGRAGSTHFDIKRSPTSALIYKWLGTEGVYDKLAVAKKMFGGEISAKEFLDVMPDELVYHVAKACTNTALERKAKLEELVKEKGMNLTE